MNTLDGQFDVTNSRDQLGLETVIEVTREYFYNQVFYPDYALYEWEYALRYFKYKNGYTKQEVEAMCWEADMHLAAEAEMEDVNV